MKKTFKEYHRFTEAEYKDIFEKCLFILDTSTLLNLYGYSQNTLNIYIEVLTKLKQKNQLWIPHQVGYEFFENRIKVILNSEKSYDDILNILNTAKNEIDKKYKDHPFLNLKEIKNELEDGLKSVEGKIKEKKTAHPKWIEKDDILEKIQILFEDSVGGSYPKHRYEEICKEGGQRYGSKIPPGFQDDNKSEERKYGDLIVWFQIIDKAIETRRPIILISGDVKKDWWLEVAGNRIMPLPQLKKEMYEKAGVDFHIYTADNFLEHYQVDSTGIDKNAIHEVRKMRESEERRFLRIRRSPLGGSLRHFVIREDLDYSLICIKAYEIIKSVIEHLHGIDNAIKYNEPLGYHAHLFYDFAHKINDGTPSVSQLEQIYQGLKQVQALLKDMALSGVFQIEHTAQFRKYYEQLDAFVGKLKW